MLARILTTLIGIPLAVFLILYPGGLPFACAIGAVAFLGALEFYGHVRKMGARPVEWAGLLAAVLFVVSARTYHGSEIGAIFPAVLTFLLILSFCVELGRKNRSPIENVGVTLFGAIYVGWLISHLVVLRGITGRNLTILSWTKEPGAWLVMFTFLCAWACDISAYLIGRKYGTKKIAATLSPNKTVEGSVAGLIGSVLVAMIAGIFVIKMPPQHAFALGVMFGVLCQLGDLSESAIKRQLSIKDFGTVVPGHGGVLDRFDGLLFAAPAAYYYTVLFLGHWLRHGP